MPRIYSPTELAPGVEITLDDAGTRHVQVLRLQPGDAITLFNGQGGEYAAKVSQMGRGSVRVLVGEFRAVEREIHRCVHLAIGMPANERMDWLIEKATELGAASIQPLMTQRSVLRLSEERACKRQSHWQTAAAAACEQCGRNRVPMIHTPVLYEKWLSSLVQSAQGAISFVASHAILSLRPDTTDAITWLGRQDAQKPLVILAGPEGGLSENEEQRAISAGFAPISLGPRTLRSETAPIAALILSALP